MVPTVGRIVLFRPSPDEALPVDKDGCAAAIVTAVHYTTEETGVSSVNLCVFDSNGNPTPRHSIRMLPGLPKSSGEERPYARWMDYQLKVAAEREADLTDMLAKTTPVLEPSADPAAEHHAELAPSDPVKDALAPVVEVPTPPATPTLDPAVDAGTPPQS